MGWRWYPVLPFGLALGAAWFSTLGGSGLHTAGLVHSISTGLPNSRPAEEAEYIAQGFWWFAAAAALFWLAFGPLSWPQAPRTSNLIALGVLLAFAAIAAFLAGASPNEAAVQALWMVFYIGLPVLAFFMALPFLFAATGFPAASVGTAADLAERDDDDEGDA